MAVVLNLLEQWPW